jgi:hypothetical protein
MKNTRAEQARINGAKSKGAKTEEGLERCRRVNLKHGHYAAEFHVLPGEDPEAYAKLYADAMDQFRPANTLEAGIVEEIVNHTWIIGRCHGLINAEIRFRMNQIRQTSPAPQTDFELLRRAYGEPSAVALHEKRANQHAQARKRAIAELASLRKNTVAVAATDHMEDSNIELEGTSQFSWEEAFNPTQEPSEPAAEIVTEVRRQ